MTNSFGWDKPGRPNKSFFWNDSNFEPKRTFRWKFHFDNSWYHIPPHYVVSAQKPSFSIGKRQVEDVGTYQYITDGTIVYNPIEVTFIDDEQNIVTNWLHYYFELAGLEFFKGEPVSIDKEIATYKTRHIEISMLNELGNPIEVYRLYNAWIAELKHSPLNYSDSGLATYTITIIYDNYEYLVSPASNGNLKIETQSKSGSNGLSYIKTGVKQFTNNDGSLGEKVKPNTEKLKSIHNDASSVKSTARSNNTPNAAASATQSPGPGYSSIPR